MPIPEYAHCHHCRGLRNVRPQLMGDKTLLKCKTCGLWIRCPHCMHTMTIDHDCPATKIEIPL